ncbi:MAG: HK97 family phage prohead protease [Lachnospiraceae bacterium]|nr:HK97 family phage prohead protease [Lachnospiraceae bacterium]
MERKEMQLRTALANFQTREEEREDGKGLFIEGYFAVFNKNYEVWPGATESIAPGAFNETLEEDIRALINHDTTLVLGRNKAGTLELRIDSTGLWGKISINPNDSDAINLYERVKRGDVDQCSFGFYIESEETDFREDGTIHWTITKVKLFEVSCCTFPAYEDTSISARKKQVEDIKKREKEVWKNQLKRKLKGEQ